MAHPIVAFLAALVVEEKAAANLSGFEDSAIHNPPPDALGQLPAIVNEWDGEDVGDFPDDETPQGRQYLHCTVRVKVFSDQKDFTRAHDQLVAAADALRVLVNTNRTMGGTCLQCDYMGAEREMLDFGARQYPGVVVTVRAHFDVAGNFAD